MMDVFRKVAVLGACAVLVAAAGAGYGQQEKPEVHGRKYVAPPPVAHVVVTVQKGFNGKPLANAAVVFHAVREGKTDGNLEVKTNPDGQAIIDLLEVGSHVQLQVIANGYATYAAEFDLTDDKKDLLVKMQRPQAQISTYENNDGKTAVVQPGVQEHIVKKPVPAPGATGATGSTGAAAVPKP
jgi:hypothetical protein